MAVDTEKQRARWRRNKRAERARCTIQPIPLNKRFADLAHAERERRAASAHRGVWRWPGANYLSAETMERAVNLAADVWLATVIHEAQFGPGSTKTRHVAQWLHAAGRTHGYTAESLRKLIPKARNRVSSLETLGVTVRSSEPCWPPFEPVP